MKSSTLTSILKNELNANVTDKKTWSLPTGTKVTIFLSTPLAVFPISRVVSITLNPEYVTLESEEGRIFTDMEEITAIRVDQEAKQGDPQSGLGF